MNNKNTIFDLIGQMFTIFGFSIICLMIFVYFFGESAEGYSTIFALGEAGLTVATLMQFLLISGVITLLRELFFKDGIIKNTSMALRTVGMFSSIVMMIVVFVFLFDWFPVDDWIPWLLFVICFGLSSIGGYLVSILKEKAENKKMQEALERMQEGKE